MAPTIVFAPRALDTIRQAAGSREPYTHEEATGGILIGKRAGEQIVILAATEPGPNVNDRRMGFALDIDHANAVLQDWFGRDPDADIVGIWHTHPSGPAELTPQDVAAAFMLRDESGHEVVSAIAVVSAAGPAVTCFYLDAAASHPVTPVPVRHSEGEHDAPAPPIVAAPPAPPAFSRGRALATALGVLLLVLLAAGLVRVFTSSGSDGDTPRSTPEAATSLVAIVEPSTTAPPTVTATPAPAPTDTPAPSPTTPATASPTSAPARPTATPNVPVLPYSLRIEPMTAAARTAFLARARAANCVDCYNVDLIGPEPYVELRLKIDDADPPGLRTFPMPSLAFVAPRDTPRTLQVFDLEGNPASPPISVEVAPDGFYILRIVMP